MSKTLKGITLKGSAELVAEFFCKYSFSDRSMRFMASVMFVVVTIEIELNSNCILGRANIVSRVSCHC